MPDGSIGDWWYDPGTQQPAPRPPQPPNPNPSPAPRQVGEPPRSVDEVHDFLHEIGIPEEQIRDVSWEEAVACVDIGAGCAAAFKDAVAARRFSETFANFDSQGRDNGQRDGLRHTYWSTAMARHIGEAAAWRMLEAHERGHPNRDPLAAGMDFFNNSLGLSLARELGPERWTFPSPTTMDAVIEAERACRIMIRDGQSRCEGR